MSENMIHINFPTGQFRTRGYLKEIITTDLDKMVVEHEEYLKGVEAANEQPMSPFRMSFPFYYQVALEPYNFNVMLGWDGARLYVVNRPAAIEEMVAAILLRERAKYLNVHVPPRAEKDCTAPQDA